MRYFALTEQQKEDLLNGERIILVDDDNTQFVVELGLINYALDEFKLGDDVVALAPSLVDGALGPMEEIRIQG